MRDQYRQLLEDGAEDDAATRLTLEKFEPYLEESDSIALIAFAVTQSKLGRLEPDVRDRALAIIDAGADLAVWERENPKLLPKRRAVLEKARAQLTGPQPARRRLRPPKRKLSGLTAGDVLALALPRRVALLRVVRVHAHRLGETPVLEELDFDGSEVPARDALERLGPRVKDPITFMHPLSSVRVSPHSSTRISIGSMLVFRRYRRLAVAPATSRRRCQTPESRGPSSPNAIVVERRSKPSIAE